MTPAEALEIVVAHTKHERFRVLAEDPRTGEWFVSMAHRIEVERAGETHLPPLWKQAVNFAGAVVTHIAAGLPEVDQPTFEARLATCRACPELVGESRCSLCGCQMGFKAKWADQRCPLNKWPGEA